MVVSIFKSLNINNDKVNLNLGEIEILIDYGNNFNFS